MDDKSFNIRVPKRWVRMGMVALVTAVIVAPLTAIAAHTFTDVPDTNTFHADIAWLKDAGVTLGCNPPTNTQFCPKDNVTREQMSAFMRRLAENKVVDAATAVQADNATTADDADTVDGKNANDLGRIAMSSTLIDNSVASGDGWVTVASVDIDVPSDALTLVSGTVTVTGQADQNMTARLRHAGSNTLSNQTYERMKSVNDQLAMAHQWVFDTASGTQTFELQVLVGVGSMSLYDPVITAQSVPFGATGGPSLSSTESSNGASPSDSATP